VNVSGITVAGNLTSLFVAAWLAFCLPAWPAPGEGQNLIPNPSVENAANDPKLPLGWEKGGWGENSVTFNYRTGNAQDGRRSLYVGISSYASGDAKWYFEPVRVQPNQRYVYRDYYRSNVPSQIGLQIEDTSGNLTHLFLSQVPKSPRWAETTCYFTTPARASRIRIFHVISAVGFLETDNFILKTAEAAELTGGVPNASLEQALDGTDAPAGWQTGNWGTNSAVFTWLKTGHTGNRSVKSEITSHTDGDAKWYFDPQPVSGGQPYRFTDWYRSNVLSQVAVMVIMQDGSAQYLGLPPAEPTRNWSRYSAKFKVPAGAVRASVFHLVNRAGYVTTDDYGFVSAPTIGFRRGLVSPTFDDSWKSVREEALPLLQRYDATSTQYVLTGEIGVDPEYMALADLRYLADAGHQIASHSVQHLDLTTLRSTAMNRELRNSKTFLEKNGFRPVLDWASPYGESNTKSTAAVRKYYRSQRSTQVGFNSKDDFDIYALKVQNITISTTLAELQSWVEQAAREKTWLILVYHEINNKKSEYSTTPAQLESHLQAIKNARLPIVTVDQALAEIVPQL